MKYIECGQVVSAHLLSYDGPNGSIFISIHFTFSISEFRILNSEFRNLHYEFRNSELWSICNVGMW